MSVRNVFWYSVNVAYDTFSKVVISARASSLAGENDDSCIKLDMGKNGSQHHQKQDEYHENENCQKEPHHKDRTAPKKGWLLHQVLGKCRHVGRNGCRHEGVLGKAPPFLSYVALKNGHLDNTGKKCTFLYGMNSFRVKYTITILLLRMVFDIRNGNMAGLVSSKARFSPYTGTKTTWPTNIF